jgi:hypothetical protein
MQWMKLLHPKSWVIRSWWLPMWYLESINKFVIAFVILYWATWAPPPLAQAIYKAPRSQCRATHQHPLHPCRLRYLPAVWQLHFHVKVKPYILVHELLPMGFIEDLKPKCRSKFERILGKVFDEQSVYK